MLRGEVDRIAIAYEMAPRLPSDVTPLGNAEVRGEVTDSAGYMRLTLSAGPFGGRSLPRRLRPVPGPR